MKKVMILATAAFLFSGVAFAQTGEKDKGRDKTKKTAAKPCPGKHCGKKKD